MGAVSKRLDGVELAELGLMARSRAGVRVFSDDGHCVSDARMMRRALEYVRAFDGVIAQHAQDPQLAGEAACCHEGEISGKLGLPGWPTAAEAGVVARDVQIADLTRSRLHICHVSCAETVDVIRWAKQRDINVTAEVAPHHLMLTTTEVLNYDPTYKVNPPLRPNEHVEAVREALADGTIDAVATDHAPHARHDKEHAFAEAAFGMLGLETALAVVMETMINSGLLKWHELAKRMSIMPAHIARLADQGRPWLSASPPMSSSSIRRTAGRRPRRLSLAVAQQSLARPRTAGSGGRHHLGGPGHIPEGTVREQVPERAIRPVSRWPRPPRRVHRRQPRAAAAPRRGGATRAGW